jgi:hypothetical protein
MCVEKPLNNMTSGTPNKDYQAKQRLYPKFQHINSLGTYSGRVLNGSATSRTEISPSTKMVPFDEGGILDAGSISL